MTVFRTDPQIATPIEADQFLFVQVHFTIIRFQRVKKCFVINKYTDTHTYTQDKENGFLLKKRI